MSEQGSIRERARRAYEERADSVKARMMERRTSEERGDWVWCEKTFGVLLDDFWAEDIEARVLRHRGRIIGLQVKDPDPDPFIEHRAWSTPCTTWAELGEQLDPDTFTPDDADDITDAPTSTWHDDLLDAIERGLIERGRL